MDENDTHKKKRRDAGAPKLLVARVAETAIYSVPLANYWGCVEANATPDSWMVSMSVRRFSHSSSVSP
jgi:hypothetical protein